MLSGTEASMGWQNLVKWIFASARLLRLRSGPCRVTRLRRNSASVAHSDWVRRGSWVRPAALRRGGWANTARRPFPVSTRAWLLERAKPRGLQLARACRRARPQGRLSGGLDLIHAEKLASKKPRWPASAIAPMSHTAGCSGASIKTASSLSVWSSSRLLIRQTRTVIVDKSGSRKANAVRQFIRIADTKLPRPNIRRT
jgi:hypothetical protein